MVSRAIKMDDDIRSTIKIVGNTDNMATYQEIYTLNFEFESIDGLFINGCLDSNGIEFDGDKLIINGSHIKDTDRVYIFVKQNDGTKGIFSKVSLPKPFTPYVVGNQTTVTFLESAAEYISTVQEVVGVIINGIFYGNDRVTLDVETRQLVIDDFIISEDDSIGLYVIIDI